MFMKMAAAVILFFMLAGAALSQSGAAIGAPLVVPAISPPKGFLRQPYHFQL
jgi:hypothetical protein